MFSFGMIVHEVLTGQLPRREGGRLVLRELPDPQLRPLLECLLSHEPSQRPSAAQLRMFPFFSPAAADDAKLRHGSLEAVLASMRLLRGKAAQGKATVLDLKLEEGKQQQDGAPAVVIPVAWALERIAAVPTESLLQPLSFNVQGKLSAALAESSLAQCFFSSVAEQMLADSTLFDASPVVVGQETRFVMPSSTINDLKSLQRLGTLMAKAIFDGHHISSRLRLASALFSFLAHSRQGERVRAHWHW